MATMRSLCQIWTLGKSWLSYIPQPSKARPEQRRIFLCCMIYNKHLTSSILLGFPIISLCHRSWAVTLFVVWLLNFKGLPRQKPETKQQHEKRSSTPVSSGMGSWESLALSDLLFPNTPKQAFTGWSRHGRRGRRQQRHFHWGTSLSLLEWKLKLGPEPNLPRCLEEGANRKGVGVDPSKQEGGSCWV